MHEHNLASNPVPATAEEDNQEEELQPFSILNIEDVETQKPKKAI